MAVIIITAIKRLGKMVESKSKLKEERVREQALSTI